MFFRKRGLTGEESSLELYFNFRTVMITLSLELEKSVLSAFS